MKLLRRRAVSPIIATLLLIAIAVASGVIVYVFTSGLASNLTKGNTNQLTEQLTADAYSYSPVSGGLTIYVRNTGSSSVTMSAFYFDGASATIDGSSTCSTSSALGVTSTCILVLKASPTSVETATAGTSHTVRVVSTDGGIFSFNVIAGQTG